MFKINSLVTVLYNCILKTWPNDCENHMKFMYWL